MSFTNNGHMYFIVGSYPSTGVYDLSTSLKGSLEHLEGVVAGSLEALLARLPVEDIPDVIDIGGLAVLVLQEF